MGFTVLHIANTSFFLSKLLSGKLNGLAKAGVTIVTAAPPLDPKVESDSLDETDSQAVPDSQGKSDSSAAFAFFPLPIARSISPFADLSSLIRLTRLLRKQPVDLVHTHSSKAGFLGRLAAKLCGIPSVHTVHGLPFYDGQRSLPFHFYRLLERCAARWSVAILTQNTEDLNTLRSLHFVPENRLLFEGNGVDINALASLSRERTSVRAELGLSDDQVVIAYFARFEPVKGHTTFLRAFEQLHKACPNVVALLAGANFGRSTAYAAAVHTMIQTSPAKQSIHVLGFRSDAQRLLAGCDIAALASEKEGVPRILMEAGALGIPAAATDAPGTREYVVHGETGLLSPVGDADALAASLQLLTQDALLRAKMGTAARSRTRAQFDEREVIGRILRAYALIRVRPHPS